LQVEGTRARGYRLRPALAAVCPLSAFCRLSGPWCHCHTPAVTTPPSWAL